MKAAPSPPSLPGATPPPCPSGAWAEGQQVPCSQHCPEHRRHRHRQSSVSPAASGPARSGLCPSGRTWPSEAGAHPQPSQPHTLTLTHPQQLPPASLVVTRAPQPAAPGEGPRPLGHSEPQALESAAGHPLSTPPRPGSWWPLALTSQKPPRDQEHMRTPCSTDPLPTLLAPETRRSYKSAVESQYSVCRCPGLPRPHHSLTKGVRGRVRAHPTYGKNYR